MQKSPIFSNFRTKQHLQKIKNRLKLKLKLIKAQPAFACSKLTIETLEKGVKYVQS